MKRKKALKMNRLLKAYISAIAVLVAGVFAVPENMSFSEEVYAAEAQDVSEASDIADNTAATESTDTAESEENPSTYEAEGEEGEPAPLADPGIVTIGNSQDLVNFSQSYNADSQNVRLQFNIATGTLNALEDFVSIGTAELPFNGEIILYSDSYTFTLDKPLFAYINDSVKITDGSGNVMPVTILRNSENPSAVFAENVLHNGDNEEIPKWDIRLSVYYDEDTPTIHAHSSIIGNLSEGARITLSLTDNAVNGETAANVIGAGNTGLVCGTMAENSVLSATVSGSNNIFNVTSSGGNAGGLIGEMKSGSSLTLMGDFSTSGTVTADNGYAGGLVGYASNASVNFGSKTVNSKVKGSKGTGGVFGGYSYTLAERLTISYYNVTSLLSGANCGGFIGELTNSGNMEISGTSNNKITSEKSDDTASFYGGFIGKYIVPDSATTASLSVIGGCSETNKTGVAEYYGGVIGYMDSSAYVNISGITVSASGCNSSNNSYLFGGIAGYCNKGFMDAENVTVTVNGSYLGGGIVGNMESGVLRLGGTTDLSGAKAGYVNNNNGINASLGQIAAKRNRALICAKEGWKLIRGETVPVDDIGTWGEVVRFSDKLQETQLYSYDENNHTITVKSAVTTINSLGDFAALAFNIKLNTTNESLGKLLFDDPSASQNDSRSKAFLNSDITINTDIDLTGTGITGLARDDGVNEVYTGILDGTGHRITLAAGEAYGFRGNDSTPVGDSDGNGAICRHKYNGLVARTGSDSKGAAFKNLTIGGSMNFYITDTGSMTYIGGVSAAHERNSLFFENVSAEEVITAKGSGNYVFIGGLLGRVQENRNNIAITVDGGRIAPTITNANNSRFYLSGVIGEISTNEKFSITFNNLTISAKITDNNNNKDERTGGLISNIANYKDITIVENRTITITNVVFDDTVIQSASTGNSNNKYECGGLLGETWNNTHVTIGGENINGITVRNSELSVLNNADVILGGLCTAATGLWQVYDVNIEGLTVNAPYAYSFGMLVNKAVHEDYGKKFALYLELMKENALRITASGVTLNLKAEAVFDELVANCMDGYSGDIGANNKAVVSIHTTGASLITDGMGCNTYQNQTGRNTLNSNTRYYYNLDVIRKKENKTPAEKLLMWSLVNYAYGNLKGFFPNEISGTIPAESYDMSGYSYYPIDVPIGSYDISKYPIDSSIIPLDITSVSNCSFTFCNSEIETGESQSGNSDSTVRSTVNKNSQHYLMHCGLFRNVSSDLTLSNLTLSGSVGESEKGSGALICGTASGSTENTVRLNIGNITLSGIKVNIKSGDYAPLLVNRISSYTKTVINGVTTAHGLYTGAAATSLLGEIGDYDSGDNISLTFKNIALDGRRTALSNAAANSALDSAYGTSSSIFSKAVLIHDFEYPDGSSCTAVYNFKYEEDWNEDDSPLHRVAYGKEISASEEYTENDISIQREYINQYYTNPENAKSLNGDYDFSACFLPYTATPYLNNNGERNGRSHEIRVNHKNTASLSTGCGTYNDPYIITRASQLSLVASLLAGNIPTSDGVIINYHTLNYKTLCEGHTSYVWSSDDETFKVEESGATISTEEIRNALSTAYYLIVPDSEDYTISLPTDYIGIGKTISFKGVICGKNRERDSITAKITINNISPFIYQSAGSVVKDLDITVTGSFSTTSYNGGSKYLTDDNGSTYFYGGVMGIVKGGDNIIDKVSVNIVNSGEIYVSSGSYNGNIAIGGYIGVLRYGAVMFRNMEGINNSGITSSKKNSFTAFTARANDFKDSENKVRLYLNPIIGRVIDGYAFTESGSYKTSEANVTMHNGIKNYSIADINKDSAEKISFSAFSDIGKNSVKKSVITVPDGQSLFLMGCIAMSGAGSAELGGSYPNVNGKPKYSYGEGFMTRHGEYNQIGAADSTDFSKTSLDDCSNSSNAVPYVIYKYTAEWDEGNAVKYPARSLTNNKCTYSIILSNSQYTLPEGFRGIGSLSSSSEDLEMYINAITGNSTTINLNMHFYHYRSSYEQYYKAGSNENNIKVGLGLFNALIQNRGSVTSGDISGNVISGITISGSVEEISYSDEGGGKNYDFHLSAGGLAGSAGASDNTDVNDNVKCTVQVRNVSLNNLTIYSNYAAGGLFGATRIATVNVSEINADNITVSGYFAGGIIGRSRNCNLSIGRDSETGVFNGIDISISSNGSDFNKGFGAGGLIGTIINNKSADIRNFVIRNGALYGNTGDGTFLGSAIASMDGSNTNYVTISDITVEAVSVTNSKGGYNGGLVGVVKQNITNCRITDCHLTGGNGITITGGVQAAGLVGLALSGVTVDGCSVKNYIIGAGCKEAAGGFFAKTEFAKTIILKNSLISDCTIRQNNNAAGGITGHNTGGMVINGYNIVMDNLQLTDLSGGSKEAHSLTGDIVGKMDNSSCKINLVGLSVQKNTDGLYAGKEAGTNSGKMYIIYADYEGKCLDTQKNETASAFNGGDNADDMGAYPYATINPAINPDALNVITSDGVSADAINSILADIEAGSKGAYKNAASDAAVFSGFKDKLSTFNDKSGAGIVNNFPVLVVNDSNVNIKKMLNSYIHLLTNNTAIADYTATDSRMSLDISSYRLNGSGIFEKIDGVETLVVDKGYFRMTNTYDSAYDGQFTLIDIGYKSPEDSSKIAYHLYIPVYVEKMLKYDFRIAALSGTRYNSALYKDICGLPVLENYGTPVTAFVTYSYLRTAEEWADAINGGENLMAGYGKSVLLNEQVFPDGTKIALVDKNRGGKAFYSVWENAFSSSEHKLEFSAFSDSSGAGFTSVSLCSILQKSAVIKAEPNTEGNLVICDDANDPEATVKIGESLYRKKTDSDTDSSKYFSVTVTPKSGMTAADGNLKVEESYYLSFFTPENNSLAMRNILISCSSRLGDSGMTPSRLNNSKESISKVRIILGNLYNQSFTFETTGSEIINSDNRTITASLRTEISLKPENAQQIRGYLQNSSIHLYHGFIIEALRIEDETSEKGIKGAPHVYGTYTAGGNDYPIDYNCTDSEIAIIGKDSNGAVDIKGSLISGDSAVITCNNLRISYDEDTSIIEQFPEHKTENSTNGTVYSAISNFAYVEDNIQQSNISANSADNNSKKYYRDNISTVSLNYDIPALMPNELTNCGVNGLETNGEITAVGYYNVVNIPEADYSRAEKIKLTLSLYMKDNDGVYNRVDIDKHLKDVSINGSSTLQFETVNGKNAYSIICSKASVAFEADTFEIPTAYSVITGEPFEASLVKMYSNYRVKLEAQLLDGDGNSIDNTLCSDYIVYTNAKIYTNIISNG